MQKVCVDKSKVGEISLGSWLQDSDGKWHFDTGFGYAKNGWKCIYNTYSGLAEAAWFYFDANGIMLTGWQQLPDGKGNLKWYYLNPEADGWQGACYLNCTTPDGYTVNESGEWVG